MGAVDAWLCTSAAAARAIAAAGKDLSAIRPPICYCVGEATAEAFRRFGFSVKTFPDVRDGRSLAVRVAQEYAHRPGRFVFVRGRQARRELPKQLRQRGHEVIEWIVYDTVPAVVQPEAFLQHRRAVLAVFSPSAVDVFCSFESLRWWVKQPGIRVVPFGQTTLDRLVAQGIDAFAIPRRPTRTDMLVAIESALSTQE
ncbi:hypothetical protein GCM10025858_04210 [Alicyclobacillus sacchari]|uniref:uroporphyrinogen-III synthase n=1 Tax=Alicyclobacillus sacchari TaxID=392010 RepID=UPI0023EA1AD7|nr:uroporphyrinogen-III synthase [Alicyclobacillus sacchari]GMA55918.1 hypothetical protein GCM10025858_04210 [Alicyclobacillus sacchari]